MNLSLRFSLLLSFILVAGCETPLAESWNNTLARLSPNRSDNPDARHGLTGSDRTGRNDTAYLGPQRSSVQAAQSGEGVQLKPFRRTSDLRPTPRPTGRPALKPSPRPTPAISNAAPKKKPATPTPRPTREPASDVRPTPKPTEAPKQEVSSEPPPFATPVPGKKGYVTSPFSPGAGFIDVTGLEPGSQARDPYSGKIFRVP